MPAPRSVHVTHQGENRIMRKSSQLIIGAALGLSALAGVHAAEMLPWRQHQAPFDFVFGNMIDGHQQSRLGRDGSLSGFLYIGHTGVVTRDGYPVATHADCNAAADCDDGNVCTTDTCDSGNAAAVSFPGAAGNRIELLKPVRIGDTISREARVTDVQGKTGSSGAMVFVTVRNTISGGDSIPKTTFDACRRVNDDEISIRPKVFADADHVRRRDCILIPSLRGGNQIHIRIMLVTDHRLL